MRLNLLKIFFFSLVIAVLIVPDVSAVDVTIPNPLQANTFKELIEDISNFLFNIALALAPIMIIIGAFYFVTSAGDPAKITTGKQVILYTLIGLLIIFLSKGLIALLQKLF